MVELLYGLMISLVIIAFLRLIRKIRQWLSPKKVAEEWHKNGLTLSDMGRYEEAIECYDRAIKLDPEDDSTWNNKGIALDSLGHHSEAIECYDKAVE